jgi:hypothetical protein
VATVNPEATVAMARPTRSAATTCVAITSANARNTARLSDEMTRPASSTGNVGAHALTTLVRGHGLPGCSERHPGIGTHLRQ